MSNRWLTFIIGFGWVNVALCIAVALAGLGGPSDWLPLQGQGLWFTLVLQLAVSGALIFAAAEKRAGNLLGIKTFPATLVAYGLFLLMASRWLSDAGLIS